MLSLPTPTIKAPNAPLPTVATLVTLAWPSRPITAPPSSESSTSAPASQPSSVLAAAPQVADASPSPAVETQLVVDAKPAQSTIVIAAADASAVARPTMTPSTSPTGPATAGLVASAIPPAPAPVFTSDGRIVNGTRSTVTIEPLHAVPIPAAGVRLAPPAAADSVVVYKRERTLTLFYLGVPVRSYFVALGSNPVGDKMRAGDQRTPEGLFYINAHNPASKYHLGLHISYPDAAHRARSDSLGVDPGGDIMIHGLPKTFSDAGKDHRTIDWTNGCVALTNQEIEEVWRAVPDGTPVQIKP
ncbi:MAG: L,D-transpeptidase family protein [Gemmatimonadaceae bacterium]